MKLSPPKNITWIVALVLAVLALVQEYAKVLDYAWLGFWLALIAAVLLLLATWLEGL